MLKKTIKYVDYDDKEREETFYFNLSKAELAFMEMSYQGGLSKMLQEIAQSKDTPKMIEFFKEIILASYGEKSPDGKRFIKNEEIKEAFSQTEAYSELFMELASDADAMAAFINGIIPKMES